MVVTMKKRLLSVLLAAAMTVPSAFVGVSAANEETNDVTVVETVDASKFTKPDGSAVYASNPSVVSGNKYIHSYDRNDNTDGLLLGFNLDFVGKTYEITFSIRCANDLRVLVDTNDSAALRIYGENGCKDPVPWGYSYAGWGGVGYGDTAWNTFTVRVNSDHSVGNTYWCRIRSAYSNTQSEPFDIDNISVVCVEGGTYSKSWDFEDLEVGTAAGQLDDVLTVKASSDALYSVVAEDELFSVSENSNGIKMTDGKTVLVPGKYTLKGEFREEKYNRDLSIGTYPNNNNAYDLSSTVTDTNGKSYAAKTAVRVTNEWTDYETSFTVWNEAVLESIEFSADHIIDGAFASVAFRNIELSYTPLGETTVIDGVTETEFTAFDGSFTTASNASVVDGNSYVHVYNRSSNGDGLALGVTLDYTGGKQYVFSFDMRCSNDFRVNNPLGDDRDDVCALRIYGENGCATPALEGKSYAGWGGTPFYDDRWERFSIILDANTAIDGTSWFLLRGAYDGSQREPFDIDNITITCKSDANFSYSEDFENIASAEELYDLDGVLGIRPNSFAKMKLSEDAAYVSALNSDGVKLMGSGAVLAPGTYLFKAELRESKYNRTYADNNGYTLSGCISTADGKNYSIKNPIAVDTEWQQFAMNFTVKEETELASVIFNAKHNVDGVAASIDLRGVTLVRLPDNDGIGGVPNIGIVMMLLNKKDGSETGGDITANVNDDSFVSLLGSEPKVVDTNYSGTENNGYLHLSGRFNNHSGMVLCVKPDFSNDQTYTLKFDVRASNDTRNPSDSVDCAAMMLRGYNGSTPLSLVDGHTAAWGSMVNHGEYLTYTFQIGKNNAADGLVSVLISGGTSENQTESFDFDNIVIYENNAEKTVLFEENFDSYDTGELPEALTSTASKVFFIGSNTLVELSVMKDDVYRTVNNAGGIIVENLGDIAAGTYKLTGSFRNGKYIRDEKYTPVEGGSIINNNAFMLTCTVALRGTDSIVSEPIKVTSEWTDFEFEFTVTSDTKLMHLTFDADHLVDTYPATVDYKDITLVKVEG